MPAGAAGESPGPEPVVVVCNGEDHAYPPPSGSPCIPPQDPGWTIRLPRGGTFIRGWNATSEATCSDNWGTLPNWHGTLASPPVDVDMTWTVSCSNAWGDDTKSIMVVVQASPPPDCHEGSEDPACYADGVVEEDGACYNGPDKVCDTPLADITCPQGSTFKQRAYAARFKTWWGHVGWRYWQQVEFCYNGDTVTRLYRNRWPETNCCFWNFGGHTATNCDGEHCTLHYGHWNELIWTQGQFQYSQGIREIDPVVAIRVYGDGWVDHTCAPGCGH